MTEKPLIERVSNDALELTQKWIEQIRSMMDQGGEPGSGAGMSRMDPMQQSIVTGLLAKLMRAATGMIKEVRSLQKDAKDAAEGMSAQQKLDFVIRYLSMLPPEQREEVRAQLGWV